MDISFYIDDAYFSGTAELVTKDDEQVFLVSLEDQQPFHARSSKDGNWTSDHTKGNKMIYDMVCAAGSEIAWRLSMPDPSKAEPGFYASGCGMQDCPAERSIFKAVEKEYPPIELTHDFNVPTENVFNAWTNPELIKQWMFKGKDNDIVQVINSLEQNGAFSVIKKGKGGEWMDHYGTYREIVRPNLLSFSLEAPDRFKGVSSVVIRIMPTESGSQLHLLQTGADPAFFTKVWEQMFLKLEQVLAS